MLSQLVAHCSACCGSFASLPTARKEFNAAPSSEWSCLNYEYMCFNVIAAWAVGGRPVTLPAQAGIPLNATSKYLIMQVRASHACRQTSL